MTRIITFILLVMVAGAILDISGCSCQNIYTIAIPYDVDAIINLSGKTIIVDINPNHICPCEVLPNDTTFVFSVEEECQGGETPPSEVFDYLEIWG